MSSTDGIVAGVGLLVAAVVLLALVVQALKHIIRSTYIDAVRPKSLHVNISSMTGV